MPAPPGGAESRLQSLSDYYLRVRETTLELVATLQPEDTVVQTMPDVSPTKWHLAHTSWFFERFLLQPHAHNYDVFHDRYDYLFNSYYFTVGQMHRRPERGLLSRPTLSDICEYRAHVDEHMLRLLRGELSDELRFLVALGLNHEQQHQELILTDIKHVFSCNPLQPALREDTIARGPAAAPMRWLTFKGGTIEAGTNGDGRFHFDNETPRHQVLLRDYQLADRPVTNGEFREFIRDGGYEQPDLWLSDGWSTVQNENWRHPLYWCRDLQTEFTLAGRRE
ncbi:MAG: SUMF1/EgtB/PvdO family nonheme iron enzyme, partial [Gammaproteobacteria bacterium]|nr:SUMF1/EgtB/PvdO family nonheme iron enzyme [Gammaproteobacteria bacterium]